MDFLNNPTFIFFIGLTILILFAWYFATETPLRKRNLGTVLTLILVAFAVQNLIPLDKSIRLGLDLRGGTSFLLQLSPQTLESKISGAGPTREEITKSMLDQAVAVIEQRVNRYGVSEPLIAPAGKDRIMVQIPGLDVAQIEEAKETLQRVAKLEFKLVFPDSSRRLAEIEAGSNIIPPGYRVEEYFERRLSNASGEGPAETERLLVKQRADMSGDRVKAAFARYGAQGWEIALEFDSKGASQFAELTRQNVGNRLAIVLDGKVMSAPVIQDAIYGGNAQITGSFTEEEARNLASVLENPLQTPVKIIDQRTVSASLGEDSVRSGFIAGIIGLAVTLIAMMIYYRIPGVIANLALILNLFLLMGSMALFGFTLTLPGIAGIILSVGMAVDANVLIYERLREEIAVGKSLKAALESAYDKAFSAIFDSNVTTLITAIILFWQAVGAVKGFAVTLTAGIAASMFSALLFTRVAFRWGTDTGIIKHLSMLDLMPKKRFNFIGLGAKASLLSVAVMLICITVFIWRGEKNFGVDFRGGDLLMLAAKQPVSEEQARQAIKEAGLGEPMIQIARSAENEYLSVRAGFGEGTKIEKALKAAFPEAGFVEGSIESVGPIVGQELMTKSLIALGLGMIAILIYVTMRFEFSFALGAILAVLHDVIITIGVYSILGRELSMVFVGAILTIAGYSINDTIVVFDRIREGLIGTRRGTVASIMNEAINQTLSRTILTGGTTLLAVFVLIFLGGPVLADFALTILIGVLVGTYSSVFIAAPIVLWWSKIRGRSIRMEVIESNEVARA